MAQHGVMFKAGSCRDRPHAMSRVVKSSEGLFEPPTWRSVSSESILSTARERFGSSLDIEGRFFYLDCARRAGDEMTALRTCMCEHRQRLLLQAQKVPRICDRLMSWLAKERAVSKIIPTAELVGKALQHVGIRVRCL